MGHIYLMTPTTLGTQMQRYILVQVYQRALQTHTHLQLEAALEETAEVRRALMETL
jgi:hypothetical protein